MERQMEWERLAEPQQDRYDSLRVLELGGLRGHVLKSHRSPVMQFDGRVAVLSNRGWDSKQFRPASLEHPNIASGCDIIRAWPSVYEQCGDLLSAIFVSNTVGADSDTWGSCSGPGPEGFGSVAVTVDNPVGFAEAIVHEMAHHKLRAIGVDFESASHLVLNPAEEVFPSPIRFDKLRPIFAVLHAEYSYTYVSALDIALIRANHSLSKNIARFSLARYLPKLDFGIKILRKYSRTDSAGKLFFKAFSGWVERVLSEGKRILHAYGTPLDEFVHPLL